MLLAFNIVLLVCSAVGFVLEYASYKLNHDLLVNRKLTFGSKYYLKIEEDNQLKLYYVGEVFDTISDAEEKLFVYHMNGDKGKYVYNRILRRLKML